MRICMNGTDFGRFQMECPDEWSMADGLGCFSAGSVLDQNIRAYHHLFQVSLSPPAERYILVSDVVEKVGESKTALRPESTSHTLKPQLTPYLKSFEQFGNRVSFLYKIDGRLIRKEIRTAKATSQTSVSYHLVSGAPVEIVIEPRFNCRNTESFDQFLESIALESNLDSRLHMKSFGVGNYYLHYKGDGCWNSCDDEHATIHFPYEYFRDGYSSEESTILGNFNFLLTKENPIVISFTTREVCLSMDELDVQNQKEISQITALFPSDVEAHWPLIAQGLKSLVVERRNLGTLTVLAGYPWFMDWGRDTMIVLNGLIYCLPREAIREILRTFWKSLKNGLIPNCFDANDPEKAYYNTIDGTLWLFIVLYRYLNHFDDLEYIRSVMPQMKSILDAHIHGTDWNIHVDPEDGLLAGGDPHTQLTWMDVRIEDWEVTPRMGKAVEINGLWYNALAIYQSFCQKLNLPFDYQKEMTLFKTSFASKFYDAEKGYLADYIYEGAANWQIRPNQVFCLGFPFSDYLKPEQKESIFQVVTEHLFTPYGLRSLSPEDKQYRGNYHGDRYQRDSAYHQGTVWGWLIGPYLDAFAQMSDQENLPQNLSQLMSPLFKHLQQAGLGAVSEVFSGDYPHCPQGCYSQAWSMSELLRIYFEYIRS